MACPIEREESRGANGKVTQYTFSLVKPINSAVLNKLKPNQRNTNTNLPRKTAFATISLLDTKQEEHLAKYLGTAVNKDSFPADLKAMFAEDGSVLPSKRSKIAYLAMLDRTNENFKDGKKKGTFVLEANIESVFGKTPKNIASNNVLKKYYIPDANTKKSQVQLVRGSASQLLECLLGPTSPLHELGVEYVILHPVSRQLETKYYGSKFGFQPALGMPIGLVSIVMMNNPTQSDEEDLVENFEYFEEASAEQGGPEIKKWGPYLLRVLDNRVHQLHESETTGPIMYKKLAEKEKEKPATQALLPQSEPKNGNQPRNAKPKSMHLSRKQLARLLFNGQPTATRKLFSQVKPQFSKGTMKRPKHRA
jgi:hypothetical protein